MVGHPADGENVARAVERKGVLGVEPLASHHLGMHGLKPRVVRLERVILARRWHLFDDIAGMRGKSQEADSFDGAILGEAVAKLRFEPLEVGILRTEGRQRFLSAADDMDLVAIGENLEHAPHAKQMIGRRNQKARGLLGRA